MTFEPVITAGWILRWQMKPQNNVNILFGCNLQRITVMDVIVTFKLIIFKRAELVWFSDLRKDVQGWTVEEYCLLQILSTTNLVR